ncbi:hypothetical protein [Pumilibacter muris]|uniref:hypothetical protein n=1 Tax=Pumilibacter muris TaxID=2941510 RepID=UPI00203BEE1E|nr:hypothetical protein [Pumilibacter muris]
MSEKKRFNYRHIICIAVTLGFVACGVFVFSNAFIRIMEGGRDFGKSVAYYFCEMFDLPCSVTPTVNNMPQSPATPSPTLPDTYSGFKSKWSAYWRLWSSSDNFFAYLSAIANGIGTLCKFIIIALPLIIILLLLFKRSLKKENNDYNRDTKPLRAFKWFAAHTYRPVKTWLIGFIRFVKEHKPYYIAWFIMWLFYFNVFTIVLEFLAFYLYFTVSFNVSSIYRQVYKLFLDLWVVIDFIPLWVWAILGLVLFDRFRKGIAYSRLEHMEFRNRGFVNARALVLMLIGTMGKGKTTGGTDISLSTEVIFRIKRLKSSLKTI